LALDERVAGASGSADHTLSSIDPLARTAKTPRQGGYHPYETQARRRNGGGIAAHRPNSRWDRERCG